MSGPRTGPLAAVSSVSATAPLRVLGGRGRPRHRQSTPEHLLFLAFAGLMGCALLLYVLTVRQEVQLNRWQSEIRRQGELDVQLRAYLATVQAPEQLAGQATKELGMGPAPEVLFLHVDHPIGPSSPTPAPLPRAGLSPVY